LPLSVSALALFAYSSGPAAQVSELDAFQRAINTQNRQDALAFVNNFSSSHLVPDLIELLNPDVAMDVCNSMRSATSRARSACDKVKRAVATAPAAGTPTLAPQPMLTPPPQAVPPAPAPTVFTEVPATRVTTPPAPDEQTALVPPAAPPSTAAPIIQPAPGKSKADILRSLRARFDQRPFKVDHFDRERGEMVVTYEGALANFVACGDVLGTAVIVEPAAALTHLSNRLNSRMIIRLKNGDSGTPNIAVDALHVVSIGGAKSQGQNIADVRLEQPARTGDGRYCWSTGEMERIAQLK
jgi:hypothetical protein